MDAGARMKHGHEVGGSAVSWASCLGYHDDDGSRRLYVQVSIIPGAGGSLITTGRAGKAGVERAEVAMSWIHANAAFLAGQIGMESLLRPLRSTNHGIHLHLLPSCDSHSPEVLGVTIAIALLSLAAGRFPSEDVAVLGELRLDGARSLLITGLNKSLVERCPAQGIKILYIGEQQVGGFGLDSSGCF